MAIKKLGVVGAGQMGGGIAQVCASTGYRVLLCDASLERAAAGKAKIEKILSKSNDGGEWGSNFVAHVGEKLTLCRVRRFGHVLLLLKRFVW